MKTTIALTLFLTTLRVSATVPVYCDFNHSPNATYADLDVQPLAGGTIFAPFFEDVEGENKLGVSETDTNYIAMKARRDSYENYYDGRMSDISDLVDDLDAPLAVADIETKIDSIHTKIEEIDDEYLDAGLEMIDYMDAIDPDLYDEYLDFLETGD